MLEEIDRVQLAVPNVDAAAEGWIRLLGAEEARRDTVKSLGAARLVLRAGASEVELLEPDGAGAIDAALKARGRAHVFAGGASTSDMAALEAHLRSVGVDPVGEGTQRFIDVPVGEGQFRFVLSPAEKRAPVGDISFLYEVTLLLNEHDRAIADIARLFALDAETFTTITSETFGYTGTLTLFHPDKLHRFEVITPTDTEKTMGRYFQKNGPVYYMGFAESAHLVEIEHRAQAVNAGLTVDRPAGRDAAKTPDQMWLHPPVLGGMMLGLSRPSMAWQWSGHPERVEEVA